MDDQLEMLECTLSATEMADRRAAWAALKAARVDSMPSEAGFRIRYRSQPGISESLRTLATAEGACCGWADWEVSEEGGFAVLEVTGPAGKIGVLADAFGL